MRKIFTFLAAVLLTASTNAQVGIGTTTPDASSALDLTSITKGFLIPRMTNQQRIDIETPAEGLMVYVTGVGDVVGSFMYYDGISWKDATGSDVNDPPVVPVAVAVAVGDFYQGGVVFYLLTAEDTGYDANEIHGLIAAVADQSSSEGVNWDDDSTPRYTAIGTAIGAGASNTNAIIVAQGGIAKSYAAGLARVYRGGEYTDWFLPSKDELNEMHLKKDDINTTAAANGGSDFLNVEYWSSTQVWVFDANYARTHDFLGGSPKIRSKNSDHRVRAVRAF
jgi:hypothetical protein